MESKKSSETTGDTTYEKDEVIRKEAVKEVNRIIEDNNYTSEINEVTRDQHYIIRPDELENMTTMTLSVLHIMRTIF